ncbi:hypothetical protein [Clostridium botulinum]|nr:hypothetical protein [Clostridium botulinum]
MVKNELLKRMVEETKGELNQKQIYRFNKIDKDTYLRFDLIVPLVRHVS